MVGMAFVYILQSLSASKTYVGSTIDIDRRLSEHNLGKSTFTKAFLPWKLIYKEELESLEGARKRERYFKSAAGRKVLKKLLVDK